MRRYRRWLGLTAAVAALAIVSAACSNNDSGGTTGSTGAADLTGQIVISGSSTVLPISQLVAEQYNAQSPNVAISVDGPGTGDGFVLFCEGKTDVSDASRPIESEEAKACKDAGINYVELKIGLDGITVMTNPQNGAVTCLNKGDLYALFGPESDGIDTWNGADSLAKQVGGTDGFPSAPLSIVAPGTESGTYDAFIELAGIEDTALSQGVAADKAASLRTDYQSSANDNVIIQGITGSPTSFGWVGLAFAEENKDKVKELGVSRDANGTCVLPSAETVSDGTYPVSRPLFIYVNKARATANPAVVAYVDFYLTAGTISKVLETVPYVNLPAGELDTTRAAWAAGQ